MPADLQRSIAIYREALLRREAAALADLAVAYGQAYRRIADDLAVLLDEIAAAGLAGRPVPISWLLSRDRLDRLMARVVLEVRTYSDAAMARILDEQGRMVRRGVEYSAQLIAASLGVLPAGFPNPVPPVVRLPLPALEEFVSSTQVGSPIRALFDSFGAESSVAVRRVLVETLTLGKNPIEVAGAVRQTLGTSLTRSLTIARTEILRPYRSASLEMYKANNDTVRAWRWIAAADARTCGLCWAMHGTVHDLSEEFGSHPNCRCVPAPVTATWAELGVPGVEERAPSPSGVDLFDRLDHDMQRSILGPGKHDLYLDGAIGLPDLVAQRIDPAWGLVRFEKSLGSIREGLGL